MYTAVEGLIIPKPTTPFVSGTHFIAADGSSRPQNPMAPLSQWRIKLYALLHAGLLKQVIEAAVEHNVPLSGENALQRYDQFAFDRIAESAFGHHARAGRLEQLTFLRMGDLMFDNCAPKSLRLYLRSTMCTCATLCLTTARPKPYTCAVSKLCARGRPLSQQLCALNSKCLCPCANRLCIVLMGLSCKLISCGVMWVRYYG